MAEKKTATRKTKELQQPLEASPTQIAADVSFKLRILRQKAGLTLDELSTESGLNKGFLSRLERGEKTPSISTVLKLAKILNTHASHLFGESILEEAIHVRRAPPVSLVKPSEGGPSYIPLSSTDSAAETFLLTPSPEYSEGHASHGGEELFYVLNGKVSVEFADRTVELQQGDFLQFHGYLLHRVRRTSKQASVLMVVVGR